LPPYGRHASPERERGDLAVFTLRSPGLRLGASLFLLVTSLNSAGCVLTYGLTRPVGVIDDDAIDAIFKKLKQDKFRTRSVVHGIVDSPLFLTK
jgi:hypothetical protein